MLGIAILCEILLPHEVLAWMYDENGPFEIVEFVICSAGFLTGLRLLCRRETRKNPWFFAWIALATLCFLYVAGEEVSWGQHFFHWQTPAEWAEINDQDETNLHNLRGGWFDQKPRIALMIGVIGGGLLLPLLRKYKPRWVPRRFEIIYPASALGVISGIVLSIRMAGLVDKALPHVRLFTRPSEINECFMFYFVLVYLLDLGNRIMQQER